MILLPRRPRDSILRKFPTEEGIIPFKCRSIKLIEITLA